MATSLDLAKAKKPDYVEYQSLLPIIKGEKTTNVKRVYGKYINYQRMILYPRARQKMRLYNVKKTPVK